MPFFNVFEQLFQSIGSFWPIFSIFFLVIASAFNNSLVKGLFYLTGAVFIWLFWSIYIYFTQIPVSDEKQSYIFSLTSLNFLYGNWNNIDANTINTPLSPLLVWFTNTYIIFTMFFSSNTKPSPNVVYISALIIGTLCNIYALSVQNRQPLLFLKYFILGIIGVVMGILWFGLSNTDPKKLLFTDILYQNNQLCKLNNQNKYTCQFYQNGLPVHDVVTN